MEVERRKLDGQRGLRALAPLEQPRTPAELRVRQLRARDLLRGELDADELEKHVEEALLTTRLDKLQAWGRSIGSRAPESRRPWRTAGAGAA